MNTILRRLCCCMAATVIPLSVLAEITFKAANLTVTWHEAERAFAIEGSLTDGSTKTLAPQSKPSAFYTDASGTDRGRIDTDCYAQVDYRTEPVDDAFGSGTAHVFTFTGPREDKAKGVAMQQRFFAYDDQPFLLAQLALISDGDAISSNHLEPLSCAGIAWQPLSSKAGNNRALSVPFDNDDFRRYHTYTLKGSILSYEVSALFDGDSRYGAVFGSVDHDHWKSGVTMTGSAGITLNALQLICGMADHETRDHLNGYDHPSHGALTGTTVASARFLIGLFDDWREGMETFADACTTVLPARRDWMHGTPFGWQSWGVMSDKNSYEADLEICDYYANVLQPAGFCSEDGSIVISLDASSNVSDAQRKRLVANGKTTLQIIGSYMTPFSLWWDEQSLYNHNATWTENGRSVTKPMSETLIKINGKPVKYDGAYCRDPTHPVTKQEIQKYVRARASEGVRWIKADFLNCGIIQSDHYYNPDVHTAVEAYNEGMRYLSEQCRLQGIFLNLSISPLFPHGYANGRRIACDTWARIDQTEYAMNAISGGWWTDRLYQFNDPDHLVLVGNGDQGEASISENRARVTSGAVTGMMLVADNFSPSDRSGQGNSTISRQRASMMLTNAEVNAVARIGRSFRPLYGHREYDLQHNHAQNLFTLETDTAVFVAAFNYTGSDVNFSIPLSDLSLQRTQIASALELWTGKRPSLTTTRLSLSVPAKDVRLIKLVKTPQEDIIRQPQANTSDILKQEYIDLLGRPTRPNGSNAVLLERIIYADGGVATKKIIPRF